MRKLLLALAALAGLMATGACTEMNSCTGNGYASPEYCTGTLHPNAGPYAAHNN